MHPVGISASCRLDFTSVSAEATIEPDIRRLEDPVAPPEDLFAPALVEYHAPMLRPRARDGGHAAATVRSMPRSRGRYRRSAGQNHAAVGPSSTTPPTVPTHGDEQSIAERPDYPDSMGRGREVHKAFGRVEAVFIEPVRTADGSVDVEAIVAVLDKHFAKESLRYRLSPFRRIQRANLRTSINQLER